MSSDTSKGAGSPQERASSSAERAPRLHRGGREFEPHLIHMFVETDGKRRKAVWADCANCGKRFSARVYKDRVAKCCSKECSYQAQRSKASLTCDYCSRTFQRTPSKLVNSKSGKVFCCRRHKDLAQRLESNIPEIHPPHYRHGSGIHYYREKALHHYGKKCRGCGYCELERMLDVHHIDGSRSNNHIENLVVLCVWCHALVTRGLARVKPDRQLERT